MYQYFIKTPGKTNYKKQLHSKEHTQKDEFIVLCLQQNLDNLVCPCSMVTNLRKPGSAIFIGNFIGDVIGGFL